MNALPIAIARKLPRRLFCWLSAAQTFLTQFLAGTEHTKNWPAHLLFDVRYALRRVGRSPAFVLLAALSLALAIGANTAVFSVARQLLYQRLAVPHPEQLRLLGWRGDASVVRFSYETSFDVRDAGMEVLRHE